ncbi:MAG: Uncharacterised protein [Opitutia bacterium UBA7350]|nr:MAG: Uncharacterised protein [Opitutae bacterium UBA7350]
MFTCKQVSKALHKDDLAKMSLFRRVCLKLHVRLCIFCGKFNQQVIESQDMCSCYKKHVSQGILEQPKLGPTQKEALKDLLRE